MSLRQSSRRLAEISQRWRDLADARLSYYVELYDSGRWKRYYTEEQLVVIVRDCVHLTEVWRGIAPRPGDAARAANAIAAANAAAVANASPDLRHAAPRTAA